MIDPDTIAMTISDALRKETLTGADVKSLTSTLQLVAPELFKTDADSDKPDPCAVMGYLCSFSGAIGADLVADMGGTEFIAAQLSEVLGVPVSIG